MFCWKGTQTRFCFPPNLPFIWLLDFSLQWLNPAKDKWIHSLWSSSNHSVQPLLPLIYKLVQLIYKLVQNLRSLADILSWRCFVTAALMVNHAAELMLLWDVNCIYLPNTVWYLPKLIRSHTQWKNQTSTRKVDLVRLSGQVKGLRFIYQHPNILLHPTFPPYTQQIVFLFFSPLEIWLHCLRRAILTFQSRVSSCIPVASLHRLRQPLQSAV